jgi:hypothetical protein
MVGNRPIGVPTGVESIFDATCFPTALSAGGFVSQSHTFFLKLNDHPWAGAAARAQSTRARPRFNPRSEIISTSAEMILDLSPTILYSLKYGNDRRCHRPRGAGAG